MEKTTFDKTKAARLGWHKIKCGNCGENFYVVPSRIQSAVYCSKRCQGLRGRISKFYLTHKVNGKTVKQHRLIMEAHIGRALLPSEAVHHINGVKTDNRIENLEIMGRGEHVTYHKRGVPTGIRPPNYAKVMFKCKKCGALFKDSPSANRVYCSRVCYWNYLSCSGLIVPP